MLFHEYFLELSEIVANFAEKKGVYIMTALQINQDIYKSLGIIAGDEKLLKRVAKYLKKVAASKEKDNLDITKTEGYREALKDIEEGRVYGYDSVDDLFKELDINI